MPAQPAAQAATGEGARSNREGEGIWEATGKLEAKMCFRRIVLTGTRRVSRIKQGCDSEHNTALIPVVIRAEPVVTGVE